MATIRKDARRLGEMEIVAFEARLGCSLPDDYRKFLAEYNGGKPSPDVIDVVGLPGESTDIQVFFGLDRSVASSGLDWNLQAMRGQIEERLLPIACDSGGRVFCLSLRDADRGSIIYRDLAESEVTYYRVASSFDELMRKVRPFE